MKTQFPLPCYQHRGALEQGLFNTDCSGGDAQWLAACGCTELLPGVNVCNCANVIRAFLQKRGFL